MDIFEIRRLKLIELIDTKYEGKVSLLADAIGKDSSYITRCKYPEGKRGRKRIKDEFLRAIYDNCDVPYGWMDRKHNNHQKDDVISNEIDLENNPEYPAVKHVNLSLSAGITGFSIETEIEDKIPLVFGKSFFEKNGFLPEKLLAVSVNGDSMQPTLNHDDTVIINTNSVTPIDGNVFAINYEGEMLIKRVVRDQGKWWLSSDNADKVKYPNKLCDGDYCIILGEIVHKQSTTI